MGRTDTSGSGQISARDQVLDLSSPKIMGILNATPDSFSDGGEFSHTDSAMGQIGLMISQGASIIDIGGESTSPGSDPISEEEELKRVAPILESAITQFPETLFSIDTTKYGVAEKALKLGVHFLNDVSGMQREPRLAALCAKYNACYILMHAQGNPKTMQHNPIYDEVVEEVKAFLRAKAAEARKAGVKNIIIDPGIGFGKTYAHNIKLLQHLDAFKTLGLPLLIGASRKATIGAMLNDRPVSDRIIGTVVTHYHALLKGADIIRVHDVKQANDSILVYNTLHGARKPDDE